MDRGAYVCLISGIVQNNCPAKYEEETDGVWTIGLLCTHPVNSLSLNVGLKRKGTWPPCFRPWVKLGF